MPGDPTWDFQRSACKPRLLEVLRREIDAMFELAGDPARWHTPTACAGWELRDMIGHLLDATESYRAGFDLARRGDALPPAIGVNGMAAASDAAALAFRSVARSELLARLRDETDLLLLELESLSDGDWTGLFVFDRYLGSLPAMIIATGLLGGYAVHGWDVRQGFAIPHTIAADAADLLVPFMFLLWSATADTAAVAAPYAIGVRTTGHNGGDVRIDVSREGVRYAPGAINGCGATLECDPATLVLTAYNRVNAGTVRGDPQLVGDFRSLFISI